MDNGTSIIYSCRLNTSFNLKFNEYYPGWQTTEEREHNGQNNITTT